MNYTHVCMSPKLEVRHLKLLVTVAEEGSVTEAGKRLHLTQSALSHQLRDAEQKLGTALFLRLGRKMVLTPAGERTECYTCYHWLPPVLQKFHNKFSQVEVNIVASATSDPAAALLEGKLDVAIMSCVPANKSLRATPMFEDELFLVMSPQHRLAAATQVRPRDLETETILIYPPREESTLINKLLKPAGVEASRVIEVPLTEAIVELAAGGTGIGFLARWAVAPAVEAGKVAIRPMGGRGFRRQWYAVTMRNQPAPPFLTEFLTLLSNFCPKNARRMSA
jgi:LysR family transcriptional regulator for metE and metH